MRKLRALSVTTIEELLGLIEADPEAVQLFTEVHDLAALQAHAPPTASMAVDVAVSALGGCDFALGAEAPAYGTLENLADGATFAAVLAESEVAGGPVSGVKVDLRRLFGPVRNQGGRGTCVGHACAAVFEGLLARRHVRVDLSPQFVYYESKVRDGHPNLDGTWAAVAMPTLVSEGACLEAAWPYEPDLRPNDLTHGTPPQAAITDAATRRLGVVEQLPSRSSAAIKAVVRGGRPVELSIPVYENWYANPVTRQTGLIPMPLPTSRLRGGHAMCVVGYGYDADDIAGGWFFILRNSWGAVDWGPQSPIQAGYGILPFLYVDHYGWEAFTGRL